MIKFLLHYFLSHRHELMRFALVGFFIFGVNFICFHFFYGMVRLGYQLAVSAAYIIAVISHFLLSRMFTFKAVGQEVKRNLWRYVCMLIVNYFNVMLVMWVLVDALKTSPYVSIIFSTAISALINFFVMKYFVFSNQSYGATEVTSINSTGHSAK